MNWRQQLAAQLAALRPASLCALDETARAFTAAHDAVMPVKLFDAMLDSPCALALGIDALVGLDAASARHLIHRARLYASPRMLLVARADCALDDAAFRALGFVRELLDPADGTRIHSYDLATYKAVPDWLNPRFWAHPERWKR